MVQLRQPSVTWENKPTFSCKCSANHLANEFGYGVSSHQILIMSINLANSPLNKRLVLVQHQKPRTARIGNSIQVSSAATEPNVVREDRRTGHRNHLVGEFGLEAHNA